MISLSKSVFNCVAGLFFANALISNGAEANDTTITTPEIIAHSTNLSCMSWRISGACFWLRCGITGCSVETSVRFSHYSPSLVVTSYAPLGQSPWLEQRALFGALQTTANNAQYSVMGVSPKSVQGGGGFTDKPPVRRTHKGTVFKSAEVYGSPGNMATIASSFGLPVFCPMTDVAPAFPYFLSGVDTIAWRSGLTEAIYPETWLPGLDEVGSWPLNSWGSVHPRNGFIQQAEDPKAGAVIAQRAADIATRPAQPHVYTPVGSVPGWPDGGMRVETPPEIRANDPDSCKWQMLGPNASGDCIVFGENDSLDVFSSWSTGRASDDGSYVWNLWRPYSCCEDRGIFIGQVKF